MTVVYFQTVSDRVTGHNSITFDAKVAAFQVVSHRIFSDKTAWFKSKSVISVRKDADKLKKTAIYTTKKMTQKLLPTAKKRQKNKSHNYAQQPVVMAFIGKTTSMLSKTFSYAV